MRKGCVYALTSSDPQKPNSEQQGASDPHGLVELLKSSSQGVRTETGDEESVQNSPGRLRPGSLQRTCQEDKRS